MSEVFSLIAMCQAEFPVKALCEVLGVSRSAYYAWRCGKTYRLKEKKASVAQQVKKVFETHLQRYGARRIEAELKDAGVQVGRYQVRNRMAEQGLKAIQPRSFVPKTTKTNRALRRSENLLLELDRVEKPNFVWVGDITYLPMADGSFSYLATWMDLYSRFVPGWELSRSLDANLAIRSFEKAWQRRRPAPGLIVHSDGGGQYMDAEFRALLKKNKCRQSIACPDASGTRPENHYDNAFAESLFSRFKAELLRGGAFLDLDDALVAIFEYIEIYYNRQRRHSALNYRSPENFEMLSLKLTV